MPNKTTNFQSETSYFNIFSETTKTVCTIYLTMRFSKTLLYTVCDYLLFFIHVSFLDLIKK